MHLIQPVGFDNQMDHPQILYNYQKIRYFVPKFSFQACNCSEVISDGHSSGCSIKNAAWHAGFHGQQFRKYHRDHPI